MTEESVFLQKINANTHGNPFSIRKKDTPNQPLYDRTLHWHDYCELELIVRGRGEHRLNGARYPVSRGDVYLLTQRDLHTLAETHGETVVLYNLNFDEQALPPSLRPAILDRHAGLCLRLDEATTREAEGLLARMLTEFQGHAMHRNELLSGLLVELLVLLLRAERTTASMVSTPTADPVRDTIAHLREHFREPLTLTDCADHVHLTPGYLGEQFLAVTGIHFKDYLTRLRMEYAAGLLQSTTLSVSAISRQLSLSTPSYFIALFRKQYGMTPAAYRKHKQA